MTKRTHGPERDRLLPRGVTDHGAVVGGLRVRSMFDHAWGGRKYYLVDLATSYQLPGAYLSEEGARDAAKNRYEKGAL
jgi:hypothetical protein